MGSLKDILAVVVGLAALGVGIWQFYLFVTTPGTESGAEEEIHITQ